MKNTCINWKKLMNVAALGAVAFTPVLGVFGQSEAQPGYRNGRLTQTFRTLEGVVTRDPDRNGRDFVIRLDNGQSVPVRLAGNEPRRLSTNDRVRVYGRFITGNRFDATSVTILRDRYGNNDKNPGS
jgi:cytochrome c-type biogenesis protein CcmE